MKNFWFSFLVIFLFTNNSLAIELPSDSQEAALEILLNDGKKVWVHGSHRGAFVTKDGKAASPGIYTSKDGKLKFKVDHLGHLTHNLYTKYAGSENEKDDFQLDYSDLEDDDAEEDDIIEE